MPRFTEFDHDAVIAANTPDSFGMRREVIDLSIERSAELRNLFIWQQQGLHIRNAADSKVGGVQVSLDVAGNPSNMPDANIYLAAGDAISDIPYVKVTIGNKAQPNRFAYLESSTKAVLNPQTITDLTEGGSAIDVNDINSIIARDFGDDKKYINLITDGAKMNQLWDRNLLALAKLNNPNFGIASIEKYYQASAPDFVNDGTWQIYSTNTFGNEFASIRIPTFGDPATRIIKIFVEMFISGFAVSSGAHYSEVLGTAKWGAGANDFVTVHPRREQTVLSTLKPTNDANNSGGITITKCQLPPILTSQALPADYGVVLFKGFEAAAVEKVSFAIRARMEYAAFIL